MTPEEAKSLSERHLNAARALMEVFKPTTTMEIIVLKATCELLIETATALLTVKKKMTQYCNDYGDRVGCIGTPDERYTMRFDDIGQPPILWCAFCGPMANELDRALTDALNSRGPEFAEDFVKAVDAATKNAYKQ